MLSGRWQILNRRGSGSGSGEKGSPNRIAVEELPGDSTGRAAGTARLAAGKRSSRRHVMALVEGRTGGREGRQERSIVTQGRSRCPPQETPGAAAEPTQNLRAARGRLSWNEPLSRPPGTLAEFLRGAQCSPAYGPTGLAAGTSAPEDKEIVCDIGPRGESTNKASLLPASARNSSQVSDFPRNRSGGPCHGVTRESFHHGSSPASQVRFDPSHDLRRTVGATLS
jgi:hypothetical protein